MIKTIRFGLRINDGHLILDYAIFLVFLNNLQFLHNVGWNVKTFKFLQKCSLRHNIIYEVDIRSEIWQDKSNLEVSRSKDLFNHY